MDDPLRADYKGHENPIREDMEYQLKVWRFERWGWYFLVAVVFLATLGVFSRGPLSARETRSADGKVAVHYEIFHRNGSTRPMKIVVKGRVNSQMDLELSGDFLDGFSIETMQPDPIKAVSEGQGLKLLLQTDPHGQAILYLTLRGDGLGAYSSRISVQGSSPVDLSQYILP